MKDRFYPVATYVLLFVCGVLATLNYLRGVAGPAEFGAPTCPQVPLPAAELVSEESVVGQFLLLWWYETETWKRNKWLGIDTRQNPMDMWITQEIIAETKPDLIVECGSYRGGSAAFMAGILAEVNPEGRIISIDIEEATRGAAELSVVQERVEFVVGSSTAPEVVAKVREQAAGKRVMVVLDSDHSEKHVREELNQYWELVEVGGYLIVQDTVIGHPVWKRHGPGPMEAVHDFLETNDSFEIDKDRERLMLTFYPDGYLKRTK